MSRRKFLGLGAGALAAFGLGSSAHSTPFGSFFYEPEVRSSANGFLSTQLRAATVPTVAQGESFVSSVYEGIFPGPTLRVKPGDFIRVELINDLTEITNIHVHGFHVSPLTPSDNVLLEVGPGQRFTYEYTLPHDHPGGSYFYHPHHHGLATEQVFKGMGGMIIIEGDIDQIPGIAGLPERTMVLQRTVVQNGTVPTPAPNTGPGQGTLLVNGADTPIMFIRPGETQRWRLLNTTVSSLWNIAVQDHPLTLIAQDGNTLATAVTQDSVAIATAQRRDILIQGGAPGVYPVTFQDTQGPFVTPPAPKAFAYLVCTGAAMDPQPLPTTLLPFVDLRTLPLSRPPREVKFVINGDPTSKTFHDQGFVMDTGDGPRPFDPNRVDVFANLGATEEWTVTNTTGIIHPFHIHINPYQVTHINGQPHNALSYEDVTSVPAHGLDHIPDPVRGLSRHMGVPLSHPWS